MTIEPPAISQDPTRILLSVRSAYEAGLVTQAIHHLASEFDQTLAIIDVKEPNQGALGVPSSSCLSEIANVIETQTGLRTSFAAGELTDWIREFAGLEADSVINLNHDSPCLELTRRFEIELISRYDFVKLGLANTTGLNWRSLWRHFFSCLSESTKPVVVSYLDFASCSSPCPEELIEFAAAEPNCETILFDTYSKEADLFGCQPAAALESWILKAKTLGLSTVLAGSIDFSSLERAIALLPNYIGLRGAVCSNSRTSEIDQEKVIRLFKQTSLINQLKSEFGERN